MSGGAGLDHVGLVAPGLDDLVGSLPGARLCPDGAAPAAAPRSGHRRKPAHRTVECARGIRVRLCRADADRRRVARPSPCALGGSGISGCTSWRSASTTSRQRTNAARPRECPCGAPARASRAVEYGARHGEARFEWFMLEPAASPEGLLCLVRHETPGLVHQREVESHPNGARGAGGGLRRHERSRSSVERRLAVVAGARLRGGRDDRARRAWIRVLSPDGFAERFPGAHVPAAPCLAGFAVRVADLRRARGAVAPGLVAPVPAPGGGFWVDAPHAGGCVVEFTG